MSWPLVLAVLFGALLHAGWNAFVASGRDKAVDSALVLVLGALIALPASLWLGAPPRAAWPYIALSLLLHIGYNAALVGAYRHGELSLTYPIMRGFAPLLVAIASGAFIGETPTPAAWLGIAGIALGVGLVGLAHPGRALHHRKALAFAFANAAIIALYTVVDGLGARAAAIDALGALRYVLMLVLLNGVAFPAAVWLRQGPAQRRAMLERARRRWHLAALGGAASTGSYAIALWAMTQAPVASVAALRETSVLFAALLGVLLLGEGLGWQRALGTLVIVAGVVALRFG